MRMKFINYIKTDMKNPKWEGVKQTVRVVLLIVVGFVIDAVIEKLTGADVQYKALIIPLLVYVDKYVHEAQKKYSARAVKPFWTSLQVPF